MYVIPHVCVQSSEKKKVWQLLLALDQENLVPDFFFFFKKAGHAEGTRQPV